MMPEMRFPELMTTTYYRNARKYAAALLRLSEDDLTMWGHMILKPPVKSKPAPWHQDEAYWEPEFDYNAIAAWLPLHDVTVERGCMQFIPGSNKGDVLHHGYVGDPIGNLLIADGVDESKAVPCELAKGGCTFHHPRTLHYTAPNTTDLPRLAYPMEFQLPPVARTTPAQNRPWVYTRREVTNSAAPTHYPRDGKFVPVGA
jgi:ectoine hydroxylase-related dioxygenase (phytanoyl-CoA dioxygenase family)